MERRIVLVSGAPGSGKTTLAIPLAERLEYPLVSKDVIKEALWDAFTPPPGDPVWSRRVGRAAMNVLWTLAAQCPAVVLEANFRPHSAVEQARLTGLAGTIVEVFCWCSPGEARRRYADRSAHRHPAHVLTTMSPELLAEFDEPMRASAAVSINTEAPIDIDDLVRDVRTRFALLEMPTPKSEAGTH